MKKFNTLVFVGRMQPFHYGHKAVIDRALELAHEVVVVLGSANQPRTTKNPFTADERAKMIESVYPREVYTRVKIVWVQDYPYDDNAWVSAVQRVVSEVRMVHDSQLGTGLIGHSKDESSYYLKIFPDWRKHAEVENVAGINATDIREVILKGQWRKKYFSTVMPDSVTKIIENIIYADEYGSLTDVGDYLFCEYDEIKKYKEMWSVSPYPVTFVTTDAVLTQSGYILLVKRGNFPFKDTWALPGGYLEPDHNITDNMIKELHEETQVKVPAKVLKGSIVNRSVFDNPGRDPRGRTITHAFHIDLGYPDVPLPKVKGGDDAVHAEWVSLSEIWPDMMAFDHYHVIKKFIPTY